MIHTIAAPGRLVAIALLTTTVGCNAKIEVEGPVPTVTSLEIRAFADPERDYGVSMAVAELTGDLVPDLVLGSPSLDPAGTGLVLVLDGLDLSVATVLMPDVRDPAVVDHSRFGESLVAADFDQDGWTDLVIGSPTATPAGVAGAGELWVYYGPVHPLFKSVRTAAEPRAGGAFGAVLAVLDLEGDGGPELVVGEPGSSAPDGTERVCVLAGPDVLPSMQFEGEALDSRFGSALTVMDDLADDLLIGAPRAPDEQGVPRGAVYLVTDSGGTSQSVPLRIQPEGIGGQFAASLAQGDFDGDGEREVVASAFAEDPALYLFEPGRWHDPQRLAFTAGRDGGPRGSLFPLSDVTGDGRDELLILGESESFVLYSPKLVATYARLPYPVASALAGDIDGDGQVELLVSTPGSMNGSGISVLRLVEFGIANVEDLD